MGTAFNVILLPAVGVAVSPVPIIGLMIILLGEKPRRNSILFSAGWILGVATVFTIAYFLGSLIVNVTWVPSLTFRVSLFILGLALVLLGIRQFSKRPRSKDDVHTSRWLKALTSIGPFASLLLGFSLSALNPEDMLLALGGGVQLGALNLSPQLALLFIALFIFMASATIIVPTIVFLVIGNRLEPTLHRIWDWLKYYNVIIMAVLLIIIGLDVIGKAIG